MASNETIIRLSGFSRWRNLGVTPQEQPQERAEEAQPALLQQPAIPRCEPAGRHLRRSTALRRTPRGGYAPPDQSIAGEFHKPHGLFPTRTPQPRSAARCSEAQCPSSSCKKHSSFDIRHARKRHHASPSARFSSHFLSKPPPAHRSHAHSPTRPDPAQ
jgi:hypothetical protein